jgi:hypothetical protein
MGPWNRSQSTHVGGAHGTPDLSRYWELVQAQPQPVTV